MRGERSRSLNAPGSLTCARNPCNRCAMRKDESLSVYVAEEIRAKLARQRVSASQVARQLGVSHTWMTNRLAGHQDISVNDLQRIADALGVTVADLLPSAIRAGGTTEPKVSHTNPALAPAPAKPSTRVLSPRRRSPDNRPPGIARNSRRPSLLRRPDGRSDHAHTGRR